MATTSAGFGSNVGSQAYYLAREQLSGNRQLRRALISSTMSHRHSLDEVQLTGHFGCVNAINFSNKGGQFIVSGGDDKRVLVWRTEEAVSRRCQPIALKTEHASNIFSTLFDNSNEHIYSAGNDEVVLRHNVERRVAVDIFPHRQPVYGVSVDPDHDGVIVSAGDDGRVLLWDTRMPDSPCKCVARSVRPFHAAVFHPIEPRFVATANAGEGVGLWDIRQPHRCLMTYGGYLARQKAMSVVFNRNGDQLLALRRRLPAVLFDVGKLLPVCQFTHEGYVNSCTMKSACFCGDSDQYIASGSDNFNVFIWKIPDAVFHDPLPGEWVSEAQCVLVGHRSIVNQVRFNPHSMYLISSGVEKAIKLWSPFAISGKDALSKMSKKISIEEESTRQRERLTLTEQRRLILTLSSPLDMGPDIQNSAEEDSRMLAFFDLLLQQDESSDGVSGSSLDTAILGMGLDNESQDSESESETETVESVIHTQHENSSHRQDAQDLLRYFLSGEYDSSTNSDASSSTSQSSLGGYHNDGGETEHLFAPSSSSSCEEEQLLYSYSPIRGSDISEEDSSSGGEQGHEEHNGINCIGSVSDSAHQASSCISTYNHQSTAGEGHPESEVTADLTVCTDNLVPSVDNHADCQRHETNGLKLS